MWRGQSERAGRKKLMKLATKDLPPAASRVRLAVGHTAGRERRYKSYSDPLLPADCTLGCNTQRGAKRTRWHHGGCLHWSSHLFTLAWQRTDLRRIPVGMGELMHHRLTCTTDFYDLDVSLWDAPFVPEVSKGCNFARELFPLPFRGLWVLTRIKTKSWHLNN